MTTTAHACMTVPAHSRITSLTTSKDGEPEKTSYAHTEAVRGTGGEGERVMALVHRRDVTDVKTDLKWRVNHRAQCRIAKDVKGAADDDMLIDVLIDELCRRLAAEAIPEKL